MKKYKVYGRCYRNSVCGIQSEEDTYINVEANDPEEARIKSYQYRDWYHYPSVKELPNEKSKAKS